MNITQKFLVKNDQYTTQRALVPVGIVVHSTGVNQRKVDAYWTQFNAPGIGKSVHGFLGMENGKLTYVQTLPYNIRCAGAGSGRKGSYNATHIHFEICEDSTSKDWTDITYAAALDICEHLCREFAIDAESVVCHSEAYAKGYASDHADVMHWWPKYGHSMTAFRKELKERLEGTMSQEQFNAFMENWLAEKILEKESAWSNKEGWFQRAYTKNIMDGTKPQCFVTREQLAAILGRLGLFK